MKSLAETVDALEQAIEGVRAEIVTRAEGEVRQCESWGAPWLGEAARKRVETPEIAQDSAGRYILLDSLVALVNAKAALQ